MFSKPAPTLADVAAHAGVSLATASRALHPSERVVGAELKARVLDAAKELGYSVNAQAQAVARGSSNTVVLVVGDIADPYFAGIASGVIRVAEERKLVVTITSLPATADAEQELETLAALRAQWPRAVIFAASRDAHADWKSFATLDRLTVVGPDVPGVRSLSIDNFGAASELGTTLIGLGYRDFAVIAGPPSLSVVRERVDGFLAIAPDADVYYGAFTRDGGYDITERLLSSGPPPQCIFAVADVMAIGAIAAAEDAGLRPGVDVAIAGFDDIPLLRDVTPRLTTVALPLAEIGAQALEVALADDGDEASAESIRGAVLVRASTPGRP